MPVQGVDLSQLLNAYAQLGQANARAEAKRQYEEEVKRQREERKRARNVNNMQTLGMVAGGVIGGIAGGVPTGGIGVPAGASLGMTAGSILGGMAAGETPTPQQTMNMGVQSLGAYENYQQNQKTSALNSVLAGDTSRAYKSSTSTVKPASYPSISAVPNPSQRAFSQESTPLYSGSTTYIGNRNKADLLSGMEWMKNDPLFSSQYKAAEADVNSVLPPTQEKMLADGQAFTQKYGKYGAVPVLSNVEASVPVQTQQEVVPFRSKVSNEEVALNAYIADPANRNMPSSQFHSLVSKRDSLKAKREEIDILIHAISAKMPTTYEAAKAQSISKEDYALMTQARDGVKSGKYSVEVIPSIIQPILSKAQEVQSGKEYITQQKALIAPYLEGPNKNQVASNYAVALDTEEKVNATREEHRQNLVVPQTAWINSQARSLKDANYVSNNPLEPEEPTQVAQPVQQVTPLEASTTQNPNLVASNPSGLQNIGLQQQQPQQTAPVIPSQRVEPQPTVYSAVHTPKNSTVSSLEEAQIQAAIGFNSLYKKEQIQPNSSRLEKIPFDPKKGAAYYQQIGSDLAIKQVVDETIFDYNNMVADKKLEDRDKLYKLDGMLANLSSLGESKKSDPTIKLLNTAKADLLRKTGSTATNEFVIALAATGTPEDKRRNPSQIQAQRANDYIFDRKELAAQRKFTAQGDMRAQLIKLKVEAKLDTPLPATLLTKMKQLYPEKNLTYATTMRDLGSDRVELPKQPLSNSQEDDLRHAQTALAQLERMKELRKGGEESFTGPMNSWMNEIANKTTGVDDKLSQFMSENKRFQVELLLTMSGKTNREQESKNIKSFAPSITNPSTTWDSNYTATKNQLLEEINFIKMTPSNSYQSSTVLDHFRNKPIETPSSSKKLSEEEAFLSQDVLKMNKTQLEAYAEELKRRGLL